MGGKPLAVTAGALTLLLAYAPRAAMPYLLPPYLMTVGIERESFAVMQNTQLLVWGLSAVLAGLLADRGHAKLVVAPSAFLYALGLTLLATASTSTTVILGGGVLAGIGLGGTTFPVIFSALSGCQTRWTFAIVTAAAALAALVFTPAIQGLLIGTGARTTLLVLAAAVAFIMPLALFLPSPQRPAPAPNWIKGRGLSLAVLLAGAVSSGFQTGLVTATLGVTLSDHGLHVEIIVAALLLLNLFNVAGTALTATGAPFRRLSLVFLLRAAALAALLWLPLTPVIVLGAASVAGFVWLAALPLAVAGADRLYGTRSIGLLTGLIVCGWQAGAYVAVLFAVDTYGWWGNYDRAFQIALALALAMALGHIIAHHRTHQTR